MHHDWKIVACLQCKDGTIDDKQKPFQTYHIEAPSAKKAIEKLKKTCPYYDVIVCGEPVYETITDEEYENG